MRFVELHLKRFGPFTDVVLPLFNHLPTQVANSTVSKESSHKQQLEMPPRGGMHLVYGPNEAGKSTTLRAITQLLFGFPHQTQDDFIHQSRDLRIGGLLELAGEQLSVVRRKGRKGTLFAGDDETELDGSFLDQALSGLDLERFRSQFGINYEQLVAGGREIIAGKGSVGELLFSAGAGIAGIHHLRDQLKREAESLFSPRGSNQRIAVQSKELERLRQDRKSAALATDRWVRIDGELESLVAEKVSLEDQKHQTQRELDRNQRWVKAIPLVQRRQQLIERMRSLSTVPRLPPGFSERRVRVLTQWHRVEEQLARQRELLVSAKSKLENCVVDHDVLAVAEQIQQLRDEWSVHATAQRDSAELLRRQETGRERLQWLQQELVQSPNWDTEKRRLTSLERQTIFELIKQHQRLSLDRDEKTQRVREITEEDRRWQQELAHLPPAFDLSVLDLSLSQAQTAVARAQAHEKLRQTLAKQQREFRRLCQKADLPEDPSVWLAWQVPGLETLDQFNERMRAEQTTCEQAQLRLAEEQERLDAIQQQWHQLQIVHQVPREEELHSARDTRDRLWQQILTELETRVARQNLPENKAGRWESLVAEFVAAQLQTDQLADRLLQAANHVATQRQLHADQSAAVQRLAELNRVLAQRQAQSDATLSQWHSLWRELGVTAKSPAEMKLWHRNYERAQELIAEISDAEAELQQVDQAVERQINELRSRRHECLAITQVTMSATSQESSAKDLAERLTEELALTSAARQAVLQHNLRRQQAVESTQQAAARLPGLQAECERVMASLELWQSEWRQALSPLGLDSDVTPQVAQHVLELRQQAEEVWVSAAQIQKRLDDMQTNLQNYRQRLNPLAVRLQIACDELADDQLIGELQRRLVLAQEKSTLFKELQQRFSDQQYRLDELENERAVVQVDLQMLLADAQVERPDALVEVEQHNLELEKFEVELQQVELQLTELASGKPLDSFIEDVSAGDMQELQIQLEPLTAQLQLLQRQLDESNTAIGERRNELRRFDGGATAAELEQQIQQVLASLRSDAEHYARLKLSTVVLDEALRRYKEKNQGPIVLRASELFSQLTLGSFVGLRVDFVEDENVLVGIRRNQQTVPVDAMSEGTSDQLFLALRLASLEIYFDQHQPIPVIIDDILINFDDERATAALIALQQLSRRTQVIYFTHHPHVLRLLGEIHEPGTFVCKLPTPIWMAAADESSESTSR